jgi:hypothetical protein
MCLLCSVRQGDPAETMYMVVDGGVEVKIESELVTRAPKTAADSDSGDSDSESDSDTKADIPAARRRVSSDDRARRNSINLVNGRWVHGKDSTPIQFLSADVRERVIHKGGVIHETVGALYGGAAFGCGAVAEEAFNDDGTPRVGDPLTRCVLTA